MSHIIDTRKIGRLGGSSKSTAKQGAAIINGRLGGRPAKPVLNEDGISIKGCAYIYAPRGQAGEYAPLASNPYRGCSHKCAYCYVPLALKMSRADFNAGARIRTGYIDGLKKDAAKYQALGIKEQVMISFTSDPYPREHHLTTREALTILSGHGLGFCTLTKGGARAIRDIDLFRPDRDSFASTLTTLDNEFSLKWEPGAALPADRIATLKSFHDAGIYTWVSLEPTLNTASSLSIIEHTHEFVDLYKIGRANYLPMTKTIDWRAYTESILELVNRLGVAHYIKKDLHPYLPIGYPNPLRVKQHH